MLSALAIFLTYSATSSTPLTSAVVLQCIALIEVIRWPLLLLPLALQWATDSYVSIGRLQRMLSAEELKVNEQVAATATSAANSVGSDKAAAIEVTNARFVWDEAPEEEDTMAGQNAAEEAKKEKARKKEEEAAARKVKKMEEEEAKQRDGTNWVWRTKTKRGAKKEPDTSIDAAIAAADAKPADNEVVAKEGQQGDSSFNLDIANLSIPRNALVCVVGAVGSGKSSLVSALIKDMKLDGAIDQATPVVMDVRGRVAYCPQLAWIQNASIKDNILFGKDYDPERFDKVIQACAMTKDLEMLSDGLDTMVGEKGLTLSGGQKARTSLARAVYNDADIYLLDDPLSAVDAHVSAHILQETLLGMLAGKTRILTTHQLHVLPHSDWVVVLRQGAIVEQGTFKDLVSIEGGYLAVLVRDYGGGLAGSGDDGDEGSQEATTVGDASVSTNGDAQRRPSAIKIMRGPSAISNAPGAKPDMGVTIVDDKKAPRELMTQEERLEGAVALSVYGDYFRFGGGFAKFVGPVLLMLVLMQTCKILTDWWISSAWAGLRFPLSMSGYQGVYAALAIMQLVFVGIQGIVLATGAIKSTANIHKQAISNVLQAPVNSFFDTTPVGRIMNRFSKDTDIVDSWIPVGPNSTQRSLHFTN